MQYKFTPNSENYEEYTAGAVLYAVPGYTAFPIRLANEIFQRCMAFRVADGESEPCILYDPCCGGAYLLTILAYFNWNRIERILGSDIELEVLPLAARNFSLLKVDGLDKRIEELTSMSRQFGKPSHAEALKNAVILRERLVERSQTHTIETRLFQADATNKMAMITELFEVKVDVVITDVPYGEHSHWRSDIITSSLATDPIHLMSESLLPVLSAKAIVAVAASKRSRIVHESYQQLKKFKLGKRQVVFLRPRPA